MRSHPQERIERPCHPPSYTYDTLNRLNGLSDSTSGNPCSALSWSYDAWGNRTAQSIASGGSNCGTWSASFSTANQITNTGFIYDAAGNLYDDGNHVYYHDAENRLIQMDGTLGTCSTAAVCYTYDAEGNRVVKTAGSTTTAYVYDIVSGKVIEETNGSDTMQVGYIYLGGQMVAQYDNGTTHFFQPDHLGTSRVVTNLSGGVYDSLDFLPFGEQIAGSTGTTHKFTGTERDPEAYGLDYFLARYNSSADGRFMSPDPGNAGADPTNPQSWNGYSYALNNPLVLVDPTGMQSVGPGLATPGGCNPTGDVQCTANYCDPNDASCTGDWGLGAGYNPIAGCGGDAGACGGLLGVGGGLTNAPPTGYCPAMFEGCISESNGNFLGVNGPYATEFTYGQCSASLNGDCDDLDRLIFLTDLNDVLLNLGIIPWQYRKFPNLSQQTGRSTPQSCQADYLTNKYGAGTPQFTSHFSVLHFLSKEGVLTSALVWGAKVGAGALAKAGGASTADVVGVFAIPGALGTAYDAEARFACGN